MPTAEVTKSVFAEISKDGATVVVTFDYHPQKVLDVKKVPSARFIPRDHKSGEGPGWRLNLDIQEMRKLREKFGDQLELGPELRKWGTKKLGKVRNLAELSKANDAKLDNIVPKFQKWLRPYQRADVAFHAQTNVLNTNQQRTGKTPTTIAGIIEAQMEWGCHLVFAPVQSLREVWEYGVYQAYLRQFTNVRLPKKEILEDWKYEDYEAAFDKSGEPMPYVLSGDTPDQRRDAIEEAVELNEDGRAFWLVLNPYMARMRKYHALDGEEVTPAQIKKLKPPDLEKLTEEHELLYPELIETEWDSIIIDEFHLCGLSNPSTLTARGMNFIAEATQPERRYALSGTPMKGKPIKLWGALHFLNPEEFSSRWNWAKHWLVINANDYGSQIEGIMPGRELEFYEHLEPYLVRRTQKDALPGLPEKNRIPVWCDMTPTQEAQYRTFETEAEWRLSDAEDEGRLTATNILAEYMRLKQFADAFCEVKKTGKESKEGIPELIVKQTPDSGKLDQLIEKLQECNVIGTNKEDDDDLKCALVGSQFNAMNDMVAAALEDRGVPVARMRSGKKALNDAIKKAFQTQKPQEYRGSVIEPPRVIVMNTAMGTAITLDRAESCHILDETWVPDDQEQFEDRITPTTEELMKERADIGLYYYRSRMTIEEYIRRLVAGKALNNRMILDLRRKLQAKLAEERDKAASAA